MLSPKTYTRKELVQIFGTSRLDTLKRKLDNDGYIYTTSGRGDNLTLTITECTKPFTVFCKEELGFSAQTDFDKLRRFLKRLFYDADFTKLSYTAMEKETGISSQTISKWINHLIHENIYFHDTFDCVYYVSRKLPNGDFITAEITREQYRGAWKAYWEGKTDGYFLSVNRLYNINMGTPHKKGRLVENAFKMERINKLREFLKEGEL